MSPIYLNPQSSSTIPFMELKGDNQHQNTYQVFDYLHDEHLDTSTNNSSFSYNCNKYLNSGEMFSLDYPRHDEVKVEKLVLFHEKASDLGQSCSSWLQSTIEDNTSGSSYAYSINLQKDQTIQTVNNTNNDHKHSRKWKSSKVRIMQKMVTNAKCSRDGSKQQPIFNDQSKRQSSSDGIRACTDCHTTTTPLWRSGPQGPKSLCNACGIRQRKARRAAMAAAAVAAATTTGLNDAMVPSIPLVETPKTKVQVPKSEDKVFDHDKNYHTLPLKKRSKILHATRNNNNNNYYTHNTHNNSKNICFEDFTLNSNQDHFKANTKRSFPRDEEEGARLLMALSCGLACSSY